MKTNLILLTITFLLALTFGTAYSQQVQETVVNNNVIWNSNNTQDPNDMSGMPEYRMPSARETQLMNEIKAIKNADNENDRERLQELVSQLDALNPQSVRAPGIYIGGETGQANVKNPPFIQDVIGNTEIRNTGTSLVTGIATATEQRGSTAGRIWVALAWQSSGGADTIRLYRSDNNGMSWTFYGWGKLGGTDRLNYDQMDMEIIEPTSGDKYVWITYGYRTNGGSGDWRTGGLIFRTPTFGASFFALSWPGASSSKRYYRLRITSDNASYTSNAWVYMVASFDSTAGSGHNNTQKTVRCTNPYTTTPSFSYKGDRFYWHTTTTDANLRDLHSDIAYFAHSGQDSIIVSYSNMRDSTKIFFAKSNISNGPASTTGAGNTAGNTANLHKQYGVLASNGNDLGRIVCVFRVNNPPWQIRYFRTTNWGNFNSMINGGPIASTSNSSYQPDIVGVRGGITSYASFTVQSSSVDSVYFIRIASGFTTLSKRMNAISSLSGVQGPKPGFRYVGGDSCFVIYSPNGPFDVWAAYGCSGTITNIKGTETPVHYALHQNYPNPFNPSTSIRFDIPKDGFVKLVIYDVLGREVATLVNENKNAGVYQVDFNASGLTSGIYFYKITSGSFTEIKKMMLLK